MVNFDSGFDPEELDHNTPGFLEVYDRFRRSYERLADPASPISCEPDEEPRVEEFESQQLLRCIPLDVAITKKLGVTIGDCLKLADGTQLETVVYASWKIEESKRGFYSSIPFMLFRDRNSILSVSVDPKNPQTLEDFEGLAAVVVRYAERGILRPQLDLMLDDRALDFFFDRLPRVVSGSAKDLQSGGFFVSLNQGYGSAVELALREVVEANCRRAVDLAWNSLFEDSESQVHTDFLIVGINELNYHPSSQRLDLKVQGQKSLMKPSEAIFVTSDVCLQHHTVQFSWNYSTSCIEVSSVGEFEEAVV